MNVSPELVQGLARPMDWVGAFLTLGIFSILWKENPIYRFCEHAFVGSTAAYTIVVAFSGTIKPGIQVNMVQNGNWWEIIAIVLGMLIYFQPFPKYRWISRIPVAVWIGFSAGFALTMRTVMPMLVSVRATMLPLVVIKNGTFDLFSSFNNIVFVLAVTMTMLYFFFSVEKLSTLPGVLKVARWVMMLSFGVGFGNTVMGRITLVLGRFNFLFRDWLQLLD